MTQVTTGTRAAWENAWRSRDESLFHANDPVLESLCAEHVGLFELIEEAGRELHERFGADARLSLKGKADPDGGDSYAVLHVHTSMPVNEAIREMDAFDQEWWLDRAGELLNLLVVDFEKT